MLRLFNRTPKTPKPPIYYVHALGLQPVPVGEDLARQVQGFINDPDGAAPAVTMSWDDGARLCISTRCIVAITTEEAQKRFTPATMTSTDSVTLFSVKLS
jgi:hypothetical protein